MNIDKSLVDKQSPHRGEIRYPETDSEFEIQSFLYERLKSMGYAVRGEVATSGGRCRFDIVIFEVEIHAGKPRHVPARIIEVKKHDDDRDARTKFKSGKSCREQLIKYRGTFGIPVDSVNGMGDAHRYLRAIVDILPVPVAVA